MDRAGFSGLSRLFESRRASSHKYNFGHVLVIGGAPGMVGAPLLTARAALRTGAGLVTIASSDNVVDKLEKRVEEVMTLRLPDNTAQAVKAIREFANARKVTALAIGPGLAASRIALIKALLPKLQLPTMLDAGGLDAYSGDPAALGEANSRNPDVIISPHQGEFARFVGRPLPSNRSVLKKLTAETARAARTVIILKGHRTLVIDPDGQEYDNVSGNPGLATAGTGDVLTGMVSGLLAQRFKTFEAAKYGVYLHGLAGDLAAASKTQPGLVASDIIDYIPEALKHVRKSLT